MDVSYILRKHIYQCQMLKENVRLKDVLILTKEGKTIIIISTMDVKNIISNY